MSSLLTRLAVLGTLAALLVLVTSAAAHDVGAQDVGACTPFKEFDDDDFENPTRIDNPFLPLVPGTRYVLEGRANRGGGPLPHRVTFTVTDVTKVIDDVRTVVVWDVDEQEGELVEEELAFFAQDDDGNVWNLGEYPEEYEEGQFVGAPSTWISGLAGAIGGIHMLGSPQVGASYLQGRAPLIDFLDCATVVRMDERTCVPFRCYDNVLVTHERSPLDPEGGIQSKHHAPGVGIVRVGAIDDPEGETLVLTDRHLLDRNALRAARRRALKLDKRAYRFSEVYRHTERAKPPRCEGDCDDD